MGHQPRASDVRKSGSGVDFNAMSMAACVRAARLGEGADLRVAFY